MIIFLLGKMAIADAGLLGSTGDSPGYIEKTSDVSKWSYRQLYGQHPANSI